MQGTLGNVWDFFGCHNWGRVLLACSGRGLGLCSTSYSAQDAPYKDSANPRCQQSRGAESYPRGGSWEGKEWRVLPELRLGCCSHRDKQEDKLIVSEDRNQGNRRGRTC